MPILQKPTQHTMTKRPQSNPRGPKQARSVFFLPGILGDEPKQADLRHRLSDTIDFIVMEHPDSPPSVACSLPETGRVVAETIMRLQDQGTINIVGFSFGANLAVEVARHLTSAGRTVGYLGLIDGLLRAGDKRHSLRGLFELLTAPRGVYIVGKNIVQVLMRKYFERRKSQQKSSLPETYDAVDYRFKALESWKPQTCETPGIMLLSVFNFERSSLIWQRVCPNCRQIKVRSDHHHFITGHSARYVASVLSDELIEYFEKM